MVTSVFRTSDGTILRRRDEAVRTRLATIHERCESARSLADWHGQQHDVFEELQTIERHYREDVELLLWLLAEPPEDA